MRGVKNNFQTILCVSTGLTGTPSANVGPRESRLWFDLTHGRPELEDQLSIDGREMKADM